MKIALGLGCDRGTPAATIARCISEALAACGATLSDVWAVASIDLKANESGSVAVIEEQRLALPFLLRDGTCCGRRAQSLGNRPQIHRHAVSLRSGGFAGGRMPTSPI
jgi:hypothetical protein